MPTHAETYGTELGATDLNAELDAKICGVEVMPPRLHVDCHARLSRKARRHDLWRRNVLPRRRRSWRRPHGVQNRNLFLQDPKCKNLL